MGTHLYSLKSNLQRFTVTMRTSALRYGLHWGKMARPYYINGLIKQELTHTQAESFPNLANRFWNINRRFRKEAPYWVLGALPFIYCYVDMEEQDYHAHRKGGAGH